MSPLQALTWIAIAFVAIMLLLILQAVYFGMKDKREETRLAKGLVPTPVPSVQPLCRSCSRATTKNHKCDAPEHCPCLAAHTP